MVFARWDVVACMLHAALCSKDSEKSMCSALLEASSKLSSLKSLYVSCEFSNGINAEDVLNKKDLEKKYTGGTLYIQKDYMSSEDMKGVGNMKDLTYLSISCAIEPGSLFHLRNLKKLVNLNISCNNKLRNEDFSEIKKIKGLQSLSITTSYCKSNYTYKCHYSYTNNTRICLIL